MADADNHRGVAAAVIREHDASGSSTASITITSTSFWTALVAGGMAGTSVDVALFPIDTLKTRLQSPQGFLKAGGFHGIYNGLGAAAVGSAPGAALFFSTYETMKPIILNWQRRWGMEEYEMLSHMSAASMGEALACTVRVPTEVVKAKMQTGSSGAGATLSETVRLVFGETHGGSLLSSFTGGLYRGYGITLMREIPFVMIQFPLYERFKVQWSNAQGYAVSPVQAAACGSLSGGIAAAVTTPLDVVKTRLMLGVDQHGVVYQSAMDVVQRTHAQGGTKVFFSGIQPRVFWITLGGFVFFGAYEGFKGVVSPVLG